MFGPVLNLGDGDFLQEVLACDVPALVAFWASRCAPCQEVTPLLEALAGEYAGRIKIAKLNVEENPQTPRQYGVRGVPTFILFENGRVCGRIAGVVSKETLRQLCQEATRQ